MSEPTDPKVVAATSAATPEVKPAETPKDPVKSSLISSILGLVKPEEKTVTPPEPAKVEAAPVAKKEEPAPAKKVQVTKKAPAPVAQPVDEIVNKKVAEAMAAQKSFAAVPPPVAAPDLSDLNDDEREELELLAYAEKKDPSKKGLHDKMVKFLKDQKAFLEKRLEEEGEGYDPTTDPKFKTFVAKNEPQVSRSEKKKLFAEKIAEEAEERGAKRAEERLSPRLQQLEQQQREISERPKVMSRVSQFVNEVADGMPSELKEYFEKNGRDIAKLQEAYPEEFDIVQKHVDGASHLAREFLSARNGLTRFDPNANVHHKFLDGFLDTQARAFANSNSELKNRDGKQFAHYKDMRPGMEKTHWTFDNEDVLELIRIQAQRDAKATIDKRRAETERAIKARQLRSGAPAGAEAKVPTKPETQPSPRTASAPMSGAATAPVSPAGHWSTLLGL